MDSKTLQNKVGRLTTWLVLLLGLAGPTVEVRAVMSREYETKAAYLLKFISYIDWADQSLPPMGGTIVIGVVGENPFAPELVAEINAEKIKGRALVLKEVSSPAELRNCQIVFISLSEKQRCGQILESLKDAKTLTVSEIDGFAKQGGIINFFSEHNKVRFEINPDVARSKGLTISSELLKLANVVKS